jgi:hypothetical protein
MPCAALAGSFPAGHQPEESTIAIFGEQFTSLAVSSASSGAKNDLQAAIA